MKGLVFLYQVQCELSTSFCSSQIAASCDLTGELAGRPVTERSVRTTLSVFLPPGFDQVFCFVHVSEPVCVQALPAKGSVEAFYEGVVGRFARPREVHLHTISVSPQIHCL